MATPDKVQNKLFTKEVETSLCSTSLDENSGGSNPDHGRYEDNTGNRSAGAERGVDSRGDDDEWENHGGVLMFSGLMSEGDCGRRGG